MKSQVSLFLLTMLLLSACSKKPDVEELEAFFYQHKTQFNAISELACSAKAELDTRFLNYEREKHQNYQEPVKTLFRQLDQSLEAIGSDRITISQDGKPECSLFLTQWSVWFFGEGQYMGFSFQPAEHSDFEPAIHLKQHRNVQERLHFTKPLADGWFIEYVNIP